MANIGISAGSINPLTLMDHSLKNTLMDASSTAGTHVLPQSVVSPWIQRGVGGVMAVYSK